MILRDFIKQMRRIFRFKRGPTCQPRFLAEEPAVIKPGLIYIVGEEKCRWAAVFKCPCGCGDAVWLNLLQGHSPQWEVEQHTGGKISFRQPHCRLPQPLLPLAQSHPLVPLPLPTNPSPARQPGVTPPSKFIFSPSASQPPGAVSTQLEVFSCF
jgi:hypothetical protein